MIGRVQSIWIHVAEIFDLKLDQCGSELASVSQIHRKCISLKLVFTRIQCQEKLQDLIYRFPQSCKKQRDTDGVWNGRIIELVSERSVHIRIVFHHAVGVEECEGDAL